MTPDGNRGTEQAPLHQSSGTGDCSGQCAWTPKEVSLLLPPISGRIANCTVFAGPSRQFLVGNPALTLPTNLGNTEFCCTELESNGYGEV